MQLRVVSIASHALANRVSAFGSVRFRVRVRAVASSGSTRGTQDHYRVECSRHRRC